MLSAAILGVGIHGPGLHGWPHGAAVLAGSAPCSGDSAPPVLPEMLSARERRRLSPVVRLGLAVASEAAAQAGLAPSTMASVFGLPHGDGGIIQKILEELCTEDRYVSPMDFHNSVHNSTVGYWAIGSGAHLPCTSIAAGVDTFAVSLLKAMAQLKSEGNPVLLAIVDCPFPEPLNSVCPVGAPLGAALVLAEPQATGAMARLDVALPPDSPPDEATLPAVELFRELWDINGAARTVPLFEALARRESTALVLPCGLSGALRLRVTPC